MKCEHDDVAKVTTNDWSRMHVANANLTTTLRGDFDFIKTQMHGIFSVFPVNVDAYCLGLLKKCH